MIFGSTIPKEEIEATLAASRELRERVKDDPDLAHQILDHLFDPLPWDDRSPKELYEELMEKLRTERMERELRE